ncbi:FERM, ARHGEF and pleckstrin domain-containing protein 2-like [Haematobia irritans]|uniref:FERM, ARHGEF and pleckstrin domain-containing protein 2-like n=1 Tax=Haematobia irritans TaxID=7368 RepID=UPI003F4F9DE1
MSLDRRDLNMGSDKSSSLSRSEAGTYDVIQAEIQHAKRHELNTAQAALTNNNGPGATTRVTGTTGDSDVEANRRKWPTEKSYFLSKELLMSERTYKKDLEILNTNFRKELSEEDVENLQPLFQMLESMAQHHNIFLRDLEHRLVLWEGRGTHDSHRIGDVMLKNMAVLPIYDEYAQTLVDILECLNEMFENDNRFQQIYKDFEQQKICYLPIGELLMKPMQRMLHYQLILERLCDFYTEEHLDFTDCQAVYHLLSRTTKQIRNQMPDSLNFIHLCELQRDINGFDKLVQSQRRLIRQGCLLKHSVRGLQQRMFFLFSDILLYGSKSPIDQSFRILGHVPVRSLLTENGEHNSFSIFGGQCAITVSACTTAEKTLWLAELSKAAADIKNKPHTQLTLTNLKNCTSSEEGLDLLGLTNGNASMTTQQLLQQQQQQATQNKTPPSRSNTATHVCWHRGATVGLGDHIISAENQLSSYLLRKYKNSSGWQKLWVVFTSFCLYFYKSYQDEYALASLPLLGYTVGPPGVQDDVQKEFVFKLTFKNHVYFFRAESIHTYERWLEVLRSTTQTQDFKNIRATSHN